MYLNKLNIFGFKSFADKVSVDFDGGVTAIVGPNGCGKTNIVDAVRWVIGEQKASVLRSSTMENVIFSGTKNRRQLSIAEVSLTIENTKGILPSEYSEITITRRCYRDGTSNYFLNGTPCRLKDITALFMDTGMGSDAYSVIELKMVNDILSSRTQDRRKLFEEAAGITKYKEKRRETLYKLEQAKESLTEANIEIRNRQRTVNAYEKIAQKQQEAREISEKLRVLEIEYHTRFMSRLIDEIKVVEEELTEKDRQRETLQSVLNDNDKQLDILKTELNAIEKKLNDSREKLNDVNTRINNAHTDITIAQQTITHLTDNVQRFEKEKGEIEKQIERIEKTIASDKNKIETLENTIVLLQKSKTNKAEAFNQTEEKVKAKREELKDLTVSLTTVQKSLNEKHNDYKLLKSKLDDQLNRSTVLTDDNLKHINIVKEQEKDIEIVSGELDLKLAALSALKEKYNEVKRDKDDFLTEVNSIEKDLIYRNHELERIKERINFQKNLLENFEDYSEGVKHLVKDKRDKDAQTVLDDLEVEDKFRIAIETALGEISNYIIVDNENILNRLVDNLEKSDKGKVTFIIKENLFKMTLNIFQEEFPEILSQEGVYGWADKFIKCSEKNWLLYRYLLDEYIIVEDVNVAKRLSKDNFIKFITLDGDIITNSFVRSGGKTNIDTLKIGREKLIKELELQVTEMEKGINECEKKLQSSVDNFNSLDPDKLSSEIDTLKSIINEKEAILSKIRIQRDQNNLHVESNNSEIKKLSDSNREINAGIDKLISTIEVEENIKYHKEKELESFTSNLEELTTELTEKREEYNAFIVQATKVTGELEHLVSEKDRMLNSVISRQRTLVTRTNEVRDGKEKIFELQNKIGDENSGFKAQLNVLNSEKGVIESDLNFIRNEYNIKRAEVDKIESEQKEKRNQRDNLIQSIHSGDMKLTKDRMEIKEHKEKIREEYNIDIEYTLFEDNNTYEFDKVKYEIDKMRMRLKQLGGTGQLELGLYEEEKKSLMKLLEAKDDLIQAEQDLIELIETINRTAQEKFTETFHKITENFKNIFRELFMEGDEADLRLVSEEENPDPLEAKIDIIAKPRGKRPQLIDLLSGGEKTLTAIALLFAIYQVKPSPFCILDEVDAPLDDANIDRFVKIIRKFSKDTQFIIVTHNKRTMEAADSMYGVTMAEEGISTIVNVKFSDKIVTN